MIIEFFYFPKFATKEDLRQHLLSYGFKSSKDLFRKFPEGSLSFYWFEEKDYKSITGVEATIFPPSEETQAKWGKCKWALRTRTHMSAGPFDKEHQNNVVRSARKNSEEIFIMIGMVKIDILL